jgi:hypothetical protein
MPTNSKFSEQSFTEYLQATFLLSSSLILLYILLTSKNIKYTSLLLFGLTCTSLIRESDVFFDSIFIGAWQIPAFAVLGIVIFVLYRHFFQLVKELAYYLSSLSFGLFIGGFLTTYVFSRLFGRKKFWYAVMEDQYLRIVKNAAEEGVELFGYLILLFAVIEMFILSIKKRQTIKIYSQSKSKLVPDQELANSNCCVF